jgi:hypothetical protein
MYSGEYDVCHVTLSAYPHRTNMKNMPGGNRTVGIETTVGIEPTTKDSYRGQAYFTACPGWIYTHTNITNIILEFFKIIWRFRFDFHHRNIVDQSDAFEFAISQ